MDRVEAIFGVWVKRLNALNNLGGWLLGQGKQNTF